MYTKKKSSIQESHKNSIPSVSPPENKWYDRHSPILPTPRGESEEELLALSPSFPTTVLNLSGLWGGSRSMKNWVGQVAPTKEVLKSKVSYAICLRVSV